MFETNLALIDRVIATVCRRCRLYGADAEDFASHAKIALMENDYDVLRRYESRSSLATYLAITIQRLYFDQRTHTRGRWHPSREAERLGEAGILLETLLEREGRSLDEALPLVRDIDPALTRTQLQEMANRFPARTRRPRIVALPEDVPVVSPDNADARIHESDARRIAEQAKCVMHETLARLTAEDRTIIRMHFVSGLTLASIARMLRLPQRPLYRRLESLLQRMRTALTDAGIAAGDVADVVAIGLDWKIDDARQSDELDSLRAAAEEGQ